MHSQACPVHAVFALLPVLLQALLPVVGRPIVPGASAGLPRLLQEAEHPQQLGIFGEAASSISVNVPRRSSRYCANWREKDQLKIV